ncbi:MAG: hypothetical protein KKE24_04350 [Candidatus Thermoplasmatota archaeon]|nr:hypothetical protein [Candidatus Thermoplasmatota archaeon]
MARTTWTDDSGAYALQEIRGMDVPTRVRIRFIAHAIIQLTEPRDWVLVGISLNLRRRMASVMRRFGYDIVRCRTEGMEEIADSTRKLPREGVFYDSSGYGHERLKGYRDLVKPNWRDMFLPPPDVSSVKFNPDSTVRQTQTVNEFL